MLTNDRSNPVHDRIPERFRGARLDDLSPWIRDEIDNALATNLGVVLYGPTGRGKTFAMAAMSRAMREAREPRSYVDRWIDWFEQLEDMQRAWKMRGEDANRFDPFAWAGRVPEMLFVDDVGSEKGKFLEEHGIERFAWLVNERYRCNRVLSFTTNLTPDEIKERYGTRVISRLHETTTWIELSEKLPDRRLAARAS